MNRIKIMALIVFAFCPSAFAQNNKPVDGGIVPIADLKLGGLLGGVRDGKWVADKETAESIGNTTKFRIINSDSVETGKPVNGAIVPPGPPCEEYFGIDIEADAGFAVGSTAKWKLLPRNPFKLFAENAVYTKIVASFLKRQGLKNPVAKISSAYKIDLDGDNQDEVVIAGTYYKFGLSPSARAGDYSFVLVRKIVRKHVVEIVLEGDFYKKDVEFGAPNEYEISGIADLNGDGNMEIVVFGHYYEGSFSTVFEIDGEKANRVLESGCGV